ncbi:MAG: FAD binding domain-containing protein [Spirochaetales bacterium]|nr:FAD binding domain-containing protein [Spirochaetales bacterium]
MAEKLIIAESAIQAASLKNGDSAFLAGGTEINRLGSSIDAPTLISIGRIAELDGISETEEDGRKYVRIGSMCTFQDIIDCPTVPEYLKQACRFMGSRTKRNMATIGGNIALRRTDSYLYPTLIACHAKLEFVDGKGEPDRRCVNCYLNRYDELKDKLIVAVLVPIDVAVVSKRYSNTVQSHAVLTVSMGCREGRINLGVAAKDTALVNLKDISAELERKDLSDADVLKMVSENPELGFRQDIFGSPDYKRYLLSVTIADLAKKVKGGKR